MVDDSDYVAPLPPAFHNVLQFGRLGRRGASLSFSSQVNGDSR